MPNDSTSATYALPTYPLQRVRYYNGEFLKDGEFITDQWYHIDRKQRHDRLLHVLGVAEGLVVAIGTGGTTVTVSPGTAVDDQGRQILLSATYTFTLDSTWNASTVVEITFSEMDDVLADANSAISDYTRFTQNSLPVTRAASAPPTSPDAVYLALVTTAVVSGQTVATSVSTAARLYSGVSLPGPATGGSGAGTLRSQGDAYPGWAQLGCSLSVLGSASMTGNATVAGTANVTGTLTAGFASVTGTTSLGAPSLPMSGIYTLVPGDLATSGHVLIGTLSGLSASPPALYVGGSEIVTGASSFGAPSLPSGGYTLNAGDVAASGNVLIGSLIALPSAPPALYVGGAATVTSDLAVGGAATVTGASTLTGIVGIGGAPVAGTALAVTGSASVSGTSTLTGVVGIGTAPVTGTALTVSGNAAVSGNAGVGGTSTLTGVVGIGTAPVTGTALTVSGNAAVSGNAGVGGTSTLTGVVGIGTAPVTGTALTVSGNAAVSGNAGVGGTSTLTGGVGIGTAPVTGTALTVGGNAAVSGTSTLTGGVGIGTAPVTGTALTVSGNAGVSGNASVSGNAGVGGTSTLTGVVGIGTAPVTGTALTVSGNATVSGTSKLTGVVGIGTAPVTGTALTVSGNASLSGNATVSGTSTLTGVVGIGTAPVTGTALTVSGNATVSGTSTLTGVVGIGTAPVTGTALTVSGNAGVSGNASVGGTSTLTGVVGIGTAPVTGTALTVNGNAGVSGNASVSGTSTLTGGVGIGTAPVTGTALTVSGNASVSGTSALTGVVGIGTAPVTGTALTVSGNASVSGNAGVSGTSTLTGIVGIGTAPVTGTALTVSGNAAVSGTSALTGIVGIGTAPVTGTALTVSGNAAVSGNASVSGTSTLTGIVGIGTAPVTGTALTVSGNAAVSGTSTLTGIVGIGTAPVTGTALTVSGNATVSGTTTLGSSLFVGSNDVYLGTSSTSTTSGVVYYSAVDGPLVFGNTGGALGGSKTGLRLNSASNQYISLPSIAANTFTLGFSFWAWVYFDSFAAGTTLFDLSAGATTDNILLSLADTTGTLAFQVYSDTTAGATVSATDALSLNEWIHVAVTLDTSGEVTLYLNGVIAAAGTASAARNVARSVNFIGWNGASSTYLNATLSQVSFWNAVEAPTSINSTLSNTATGLIGYYKLLSVSGTNASDACNNTGHIGNGTINGGTSFSSSSAPTTALSWDGTEDVTVGYGGGNLNVNGTLYVNDDAYLGDNPLYIRGDTNHGVVYAGETGGTPFTGTASSNPDGPVLFGYGGGGLASLNGGKQYALTWDDSQNVTVPGNLTVNGSNAVVCKEEKVRIVRGVVSSNFGIISGAGWTVAQLSINGTLQTANYVITFTTAFSTIPAVTAQMILNGTTNGGAGDVSILNYVSGNPLDGVEISGVSASQVVIKCGNEDGTATDRAFAFIAVGT